MGVAGAAAWDEGWAVGAGGAAGVEAAGWAGVAGTFEVEAAGLGSLGYGKGGLASCVGRGSETRYAGACRSIMPYLVYHAHNKALLLNLVGLDRLLILEDLAC